MNRALRAAVLGVLLLSPVALSACSAGQVTQTESQHRDKTGPMATVGDISLREIHLAYPNGGQYKSGDDAELTMAIINGGGEDDSLVDIGGDSFSDVRITGGGNAAGNTGSTSSGSGGSGSNGITIPAHSAFYLGQEGPTVALTNLSESLTPGQSIEITLTFEKAGEVTVQASVATPSRSLPRGESYDFSKENSASSEG